MFKHSVRIVVAILLLSLTTNYAQGKHGLVGKFLKTNDADILFGKVTQSIPVNKNDLIEAVNNAKEYILFSFKNNHLNITNEKKVKLTANSYNADEKEVMFFYSKDIINSLINIAGGNQIFIEQRSTKVNTFTVKPFNSSRKLSDIAEGITKTGGITNTTTTMDTGITLDFSGLCPPMCD